MNILFDLLLIWRKSLFKSNKSIEYCHTEPTKNYEINKLHLQSYLGDCNYTIYYCLINSYELHSNGLNSALKCPLY